MGLRRDLGDGGRITGRRRRLGDDRVGGATKRPDVAGAASVVRRLVRSALVEHPTRVVIHRRRSGGRARATASPAGVAIAALDEGKRARLFERHLGRADR